MPTIGNILAVDDEDGITEYMEYLLGREGFRVDTASGGWEAWEKISVHSYDLIISDVRMDKGDGIELLEKVRDMPAPKPKIALMSAFTDVALSDVYERGAVALITKPAKSDAIIAVVKKNLLPPAQRWSVVTPEPEGSLDLTFASFDEAQRLGFLAVGSGGIFLKVDQQFFVVDSTVNFTLTFSDATPARISGSCIVRWTRSRAPRNFYQGIGLELVGLDGASLESIRSIIERDQPDAFIPIGMIPATAR